MFLKKIINYYRCVFTNIDVHCPEFCPKFELKVIFFNLLNHNHLKYV